MPPLQIYNPRERAAVAAADVGFRLAARIAARFRSPIPPEAPRRILLLRLERIGDLLMTLPAIQAVRAACPGAEITLVVGGWNEPLARSIAAVSRVEVMSARWLARGEQGASFAALLQQARAWRVHRYDLAINFEPDVRSNLLAAASGARWTAGYGSGGGGPLLDQALEYRPSEHTSDNARRLVEAVLPAASAHTTSPVLELPLDARRRAAALLADAGRRYVAMHVPGGRAVKQWDPRRFAEVAAALVEQRGATIVLTGSSADRPLVTSVRETLPASAVIDASSGLDLLTVAAVLERCELIVTGDTGPMHLAAAVGTTIVAVFGPSDPARYGPRGKHDRIVRVDLPCAPCNRIRLPPARCTGRSPDCLTLIQPDRVIEAALAVLDAGASPARAELGR